MEKIEEKIKINDKTARIFSYRYEKKKHVGYRLEDMRKFIEKVFSIYPFNKDIEIIVFYDEKQLDLFGELTSDRDGINIQVTSNCYKRCLIGILHELGHYYTQNFKRFKKWKFNSPTGKLFFKKEYEADLWAFNYCKTYEPELVEYHLKELKDRVDITRDNLNSYEKVERMILRKL